jgi:hypothetical protein
MAFKRHILPDAFASGDALTADLIGIGILLAAEPSKSPNIENTVVAASIEGMKGDYRTLGLLVDWLEEHGERLNADRLARMLKLIRDDRVRCFWKAIARWRSKDLRLTRLKQLYRGPRLDLLDSESEFLVNRKGEDSRFEKSCLRVPRETLRHRPSDILSAVELAKVHDAYRQRVVIGPSYRADMWALLERVGKVSAAELARKAFGSFATAWQVLRDWSIVRLPLDNEGEKITPAS